MSDCCNNCGTPIPVGAAGAAQVTIVAYANDANGSGFSLTNGSLNFYAIAAFSPNYVPVVTDYAGLWFNRTVTNGTSGTTVLYSVPTDFPCDGTSINQYPTLYVMAGNTLSTNGDFIVVECVALGTSLSSTANPAFITTSINTLQSGGCQILAQKKHIIKLSTKIIRVSASSYSYETVGTSLSTQISIDTNNGVTGVDFTTSQIVGLTIKKNSLTTTSGSITVRNKTITLFKQ